MIPNLTFCSSNNDILNNFTLEFKNSKTNIEYINYVYSFPKYLLYTLFELVLSILLLIGAINCFCQVNRTTLLYLIMSSISSAISIVSLIIFCLLTKNTNQRKVLLYFLICSHTFNLGIMLFCSRLLIALLDVNEELSHLLYIILIGVYILLIIFYAIVIGNSFIVNLFTSIVLCILFFNLEITSENLTNSLYCYPVILIIRLFLYFLERKDKLFFYYFKKLNVIHDIYRNVSNNFCIASFSNDDHCFINQNYLEILSMLTQSKEIKQMKDYEYYSNDYKITTNASNVKLSFVSFMKLKCFTKLDHRNEALPEELSTLLQNINEDDIATIDEVLNYVRTHGYLFNKLITIGEKTSKYYKDRSFIISLLYAEKYDAIIYLSSEKKEKDNEYQSEGDLQLQKFSMFASKITHDIKNPLQAIQKLIQNAKTFIMNKEPQKAIFDNLNSITNYSEYMLIITKDFECFAKRLMNPNTEKLFEIELQKINIRKTIQFCSDLIMQIQNKMTVYVNIDISDDVDQFIYTDDIRLKQIIINLLSNSIKFTKIGSIHIKCANYDTDNVIITVSDTGFGMKKEELDKLNKEQTVFYKTSINNSYGSGLGLSIVKTLIKLLGKDLKIESVFNKGTTITFLINKNTKLMPKVSIQSYKNNQQTLMSESTMKFISKENNNTQDDDSMKQITRRVEFDLIKPNYPVSLMTKLVKSSTTNSNPNQRLKDGPFMDYPRSQTNYRSSLYIERLTAANKDYEVIRACSIQRNDNEEMEKQPGENSIVDESNMLRILIVEDVNDIRNSQMNLIKSYCKTKKIKVSIEECCDGFECLFKIYQGFSLNQKYACIITDDSMKFLSGTFTAYILKTLMQDKTIYPIKIYLTSANSFPRHLIEGIQLFDGVYNKPLDKYHIETVFNAGFY